VLQPGDEATKWYSTAHTASPAFTGTAPPNAQMTLFAVRNGSYGWKKVGEGKADASGHWTVASHRLHTGRYRFAVRASTSPFPNHPGGQITPRARLGSVTVHAPRRPNLI
jgi:hypothetical protein